MKVLVADDHTIVREGLKQIVKSLDVISQTDEAASGDEAWKMIRNGAYDLVILDISMPGRSGLEVLEDIKAQRPKLAVLILSMHPEEQYAVRALRAGASGYLTKASAPQELIGAIRKVASGGKYVTASLAEKLADCFKAKKVMPRPSIRGMIAPTYFYMSKRYDLRLSKQDRQLYEAWNKTYPVQAWERQRNQAVACVMGRGNEFVGPVNLKACG